MFNDLKDENTVFDILSDFHSTAKRVFVTENLIISVKRNLVFIFVRNTDLTFQMTTHDFAKFLVHQLGFDCFESDEKFMETIRTWGLCFDGELFSIVKKFFSVWNTMEKSVVMSEQKRQFTIWIDNCFSTWGTF